MDEILLKICAIVFHPFDLHKMIPSDILCVLDSNVHFILKRTFLGVKS